MIKPMLAKDAPEDLSTLTFPLIVQPKIDGIRVLIIDGQAKTRSLKDVPNKEIREYLSRPEFNGLDGEIVVGRPTAHDTMQQTSTFFMAKNKTGADWKFYVFDDFTYEDNDFTERYEHLAAELGDDPRIVLVQNALCQTPQDVVDEERLHLEAGYEGIMLRTPDAPYKFGRSGKKGPLLKLKRFIDFEARIAGVYEKMHNANEATTNELGRTQRSTAKAGLVGTNVLGGFICEAINGPHEGQRFRVGTGFNDEQRTAYWEWANEHPAVLASHGQGSLKGRTIKVKSFLVGSKDAPRFPVFVDFRDMEVDG